MPWTDLHLFSAATAKPGSEDGLSEPSSTKELEEVETQVDSVAESIEAALVRGSAAAASAPIAAVTTAAPAAADAAADAAAQAAEGALVAKMKRHITDLAGRGYLASALPCSAPTAATAAAAAAASFWGPSQLAPSPAAAHTAAEGGRAASPPPRRSSLPFVVLFLPGDGLWARCAADALIHAGTVRAQERVSACACCYCFSCCICACAGAAHTTRPATPVRVCAWL